MYIAPSATDTFEMLKLLSGTLPQAGRAVSTQLVSRELRAVSHSKALYVRQYASQPAPSPAESVSKHSPSFRKLANAEQWKSLDYLALQGTTKMLINGEFRDSGTSEWLDVKNPVSI